MTVSREVRGRILLILNDIKSPFFTAEEKGEALKFALDLPTHNAFSKQKILEWCEWLWENVFEVNDERE